MRLPRKGPTYRAAEPSDRVLRAQGVPTRYWSVKATDGPALARHISNILVPRSWLDDKNVRHVSVARQRQTLAELFGATALDRSYVLCIGSEPTDELAMTLATALMRRARDLRLRPVCLSMQRSPEDGAFSYEPDVVVLHNLQSDCHSMRTQVCRDWLDWLDDTFRIVVVAGTDPYSFCHKRLAYPVDAALYLRGELREDV